MVRRAVGSQKLVAGPTSLRSLCIATHSRCFQFFAATAGVKCLLFEIRLVVSQEVARVVGYILKECLAGDAFVVALVAGLISMEGPAISAQIAWQRAPPKRSSTRKQSPPVSQASPSSTRPHAIGTNSTRPDVNRGWLPTPLPSGQAIGRDDQL